MEFINTGTGRIPIPDAVVAASDNRDLIAEYAAASPADREHIHQLAKEQLGETPTPSPAPATDASAPSAAAPVVDSDAAAPSAPVQE